MTNREVKQKSILGSGLRGGIAGVIATAALLFGCAALIQNEIMLTHALMQEAVIASAFLGATLAGIISACRQGRGVLLAGAAAGSIHFLFLILLALLSVKAQVFSVMTIKLIVSCLTGSAFGGVLCMGKKHKTTKYR